MLNPKSWPESASKIGTALLSQHKLLRVIFHKSFTFWYVHDVLIQREHNVIVLLI